MLAAATVAGPSTATKTNKLVHALSTHMHSHYLGFKMINKVLVGQLLLYLSLEYSRECECRGKKYIFLR